MTRLPRGAENPVAGVATVSHDVSLLVALQEIVDVMVGGGGLVKVLSVKVNVPFDGDTSILAWERVNVVAVDEAIWVTSMVRIMLLGLMPTLEMVIRPLRVPPVLAREFTTMLPLPPPLGDETVSHDVALLVTVHEATVDVTAILNEFASLGTVYVGPAGTMVSTGISWTTVKVTESSLPVIVMLPVREDEAAV